MPDPVVVRVVSRRTSRCGAGLDPEVVVLAVPVDRQTPGEQAARMRAHRHLAHREHPVRGDPDHIRVIGERVDDALDGHDRAPLRRERTPDAFEQRRRDRDVPIAIRDRRVQDRDVGGERREQADLAERRVDEREPVVGRHRRVHDRASRDRGQALRRGLEPLAEREERPVLDVDLTRLVGALEPRVRGEVREGVAGVPGDHLLHEPAPKEERAEAREAQHHQRELGIPVPPLPHHLTRGRAPAGVPDDEVQRVARVHVLRDRVAHGSPDSWPAHGGHARDQAGPRTRSATRWRCQPW